MRWLSNFLFHCNLNGESDEKLMEMRYDVGKSDFVYYIQRYMAIW